MQSLSFWKSGTAIALTGFLIKLQSTKSVKVLETVGELKVPSSVTIVNIVLGIPHNDCVLPPINGLNNTTPCVADQAASMISSWMNNLTDQDWVLPKHQLGPAFYGLRLATSTLCCCDLWCTVDGTLSTKIEILALKLCNSVITLKF